MGRGRDCKRKLKRAPGFRNENGPIDSRALAFSFAATFHADLSQSPAMIVEKKSPFHLYKSRLLLNIENLRGIVNAR
jgi:hypothetical protein